MKFSIIIPVYNVEKFLPRCFESIEAQTLPDFEIIIIDDGSTDSSGEICDRFATKDKRAVVVHKPNGGLVSARKTGAALAKGDYVLCLDGDDWLDKKYCAVLSEAIEKSGADIIACGFIAANKNSERKVSVNCTPGFYNRERMEKEIFPFLIEDKYGRYFSPTLWGKAIKRELYAIQQSKVDDRIKIAEDQACTRPCIFLAQSLYILDDCLYYYRQNSESMTKNKSVFNLYGAELVFRHLKNEMNLELFDFAAQADRQFTHNLFNAVYSQFYEKQESEKMIGKRIKEYLKSDFVKERLKYCRYDVRNIKGCLAKFTLKYRWLFLIKLYSKLK